MNGVVSGGWPFVLAAYGITAALVGLYTFGALTGYRKALRRSQWLAMQERENS